MPRINQYRKVQNVQKVQNSTAGAEMYREVREVAERC
jgi:hypothetical protein